MKQSIFTILLALLMSLFEARVYAHDFSANNQDGVTIYYDYIGDYTGDEVRVTYYSISGNVRHEYFSCSGSLVIPEIVELRDKTYRVVSIGSNAFLGSSITSVTIPNSVKYIGSGAFSGCSSLESVTIPPSITSIGYNAFSGCSSLSSIVVEKNNTVYDSRNSCNAIIETQSGVLLAGCKNTVIPDEVTTIGSFAFYGCSGLTSVTIPNSVTSIGNSAFSGCSSLTSVTIPNSVTSIGNSAFYGCSSLTSIIIPNSISSINESTFSCCSGLTSVIISEGLKTIDKTSFKECSNLKSVTIPIGVTNIDKTAFEKCNSLISIIVPVSDLSTFCKNTHLELIDSKIGKPVTLIDDEGNVIKEFIIPDGVTEIGNYAFKKCTGLISVTIPNSVTYIQYNAFDGCNNLENIKLEVVDFSDFCNNERNRIISYYIEKPITLINNNREEIKEYIIPDGVIEIGNNAFKNCVGLTSVTLPNSVKTIGSNAFEGCSGLTFVRCNCSPSNIGYSVFKDCNKLTEVVFDCETVTSLFSAVPSIKKVTMKDNVTEIDHSAFSNCLGLHSVTIPNSVKSIGEYAFFDCKNLASVTIGSGVTFIGNGAFSSNYKNMQKTIWLTNTPPSGYTNAKGLINYVANDQFTSLKNTIEYQFLSSMFEVDGIIYVPVNPSERTCDAIDCVYDESAAQTKLASVVSYKGIEMTVKKIQPYIAYNNPFIEDVKIDFNGDIAEYSFASCSNFKSVTLSEKITVLGEYAFNKCPELQSVTLGGGSISRYAFADCNKLHTLSLGDMVTQIDESSFNNCVSLPSIIIPNSVTSIGNSAFYGCTGMTTATIGNGVNSIGKSAFSNCSSLISVSMGSAGGSINEWAFNECTSLEKLSIGTQMKNIKSYAFHNCKALQAITIPKSVTTIDNSVFYGCERLEKVIIDDRTEVLKLGSNGSNPLFSSCPLDSVYIGGNISYNATQQYGYSPFYRNTSLRAVKITDKETEISENEFYACTNLQRVIIGDGVTSIGNWAFSGCSSLKFFTFGSEVKTIGQEAFSDCTALAEITSRAINPPTCGSQALDDISKWDCQLYVPKGYLAAYQAAEQWKDFFFMEEKDVVSLNSEPIIIGKSGKASYCGNQSLDFSGSEEIKAYIATGFDKDEEIIWLTRVKDVPAGTPVLIKGVANKTYDVPVTDSKNSYYKNMFKGNTSGETVQVNETDGDMVNYYLSGDGTFKSVKSYANIGNNKSYLQLPGTFASAEAGTTQTVKVGSSGKASFAAPVDLDFTNVDGLKAFTATGYDKSSKTIWLTRVMKVQKGEGVLLKGDEGDYQIPSAAVQSSYMNMFVGNTSGASVQVQSTSDDGSQTNFYLKGDGTFVSVNGYVNIGNNKSYLALPTSMVAAASTRGAEASYLLEEPEVIKLPISFRSIDNDGNGTTAIHESVQSSKEDGAYYSLQGQRVVNPGKGIYIKNGKKVIIR